MEFSEIWGFLKILSETMKIYQKNVKLIASIATLSLLLSSILFLLFSFAYQSATTYMYNNSITDESGGILIIFLFALVFAVKITFIFAYIAVANATGFATVITTAASYTDTKLSPRDLFSAVKTKRKTPFRYGESGGILIILLFALVFAVEITFIFAYIAIANATGFAAVITTAASYTDTKFSLSAVKTKRKTYNLSRRGSPLYFLCFVAGVAAVYLVMLYPNPATITVVSVGGVAIFVYSLYASVVPAVAYVISAVEDGGCEAAEALEKAEKLVEGQRAHGFMVNLFFNVVVLIVCVGLWMIVGDRGRFNLTVYGLVFVNCALLSRIFVGVVYTVYYFRCKGYHGEQIQPFGDSVSTKLIHDIP